MDPDKIRAALLHEVAKRATSHNLQPAVVLNSVAAELKIRDDGADARALLTAWSDLFRGGFVSWGHNLSNIDPPFYHVTEKGSRIIKTLSRDPSNPAGYRAYLTTKTKINAIAESYIAEALDTYNSGSFKASAVMVGAASESLVLELRDVLSAKIMAIGEQQPAKLSAWQIKSVLGAIEAALDSRKRTMPVGLRETFEAYWPAFIQQIRVVRNDAGHPTSITPVSEEAVHAALLVFPELAAMSAMLSEWINNTYA